MAPQWPQLGACADSAPPPPWRQIHSTTDTGGPGRLSQAGIARGGSPLGQLSLALHVIPLAVVPSNDWRIGVIAIALGPPIIGVTGAGPCIRGH